MCLPKTFQAQEAITNYIKNAECYELFLTAFLRFNIDSGVKTSAFCLIYMKKWIKSSHENEDEVEYILQTPNKKWNS